MDILAPPLTWQETLLETRELVSMRSVPLTSYESDPDANVSLAAPQRQLQEIRNIMKRERVKSVILLCHSVGGPSTNSHFQL
jgi:hypothetical protein